MRRETLFLKTYANHTIPTPPHTHTTTEYLVVFKITASRDPKVICFSDPKNTPTRFNGRNLT